MAESAAHNKEQGRGMTHRAQPIVLQLPCQIGRRAALAGLGAGPWRPFDRTAIAAEVARGRTVFVDVTAAWCLVCKVNELTVLDRDPVAARLRAPGVMAMRADWTRPSPAITAYLQSFGRYGVPLDVVYGPGAPQGIKLPDLLTAGAVMQAFAKAAGPPRVTTGGRRE